MSGRFYEPWYILNVEARFSWPCSSVSWTRRMTLIITQERISFPLDQLQTLYNICLFADTTGQQYKQIQDTGRMQTSVYSTHCLSILWDNAVPYWISIFHACTCVKFVFIPRPYTQSVLHSRKYLAIEQHFLIFVCSQMRIKKVQTGTS